ncbi:MAG: transposase [Ponticaulis sp.]|nr:transposase [Ponticaulis sp.]|tara:strand:- start:60152 stop:61813 length:1662 start_codon:yes stop_codon:yes gene_type:complete
MSSILESENASPFRARFVAGALCLAFGAVGIQGGVVALTGDGADGRFAKRANREAPQLKRADVLDRNGERLATSISVYSLYADPTAIWDASEVAGELVSVFPELDFDTLYRRLSDLDRQFVWVKRSLTAEERTTVFNLGLEGLGFREESRRYYPKGSLASHVLGFTDVDGNGLSGLEYTLEDRLSTSMEPVQLTIDAGVQYSLEAELNSAAVKTGAKGGAGVVMDARSGEVLGMASWPAFDPNRPQDSTSEARFDRATGGVYELGSVFKPLTVSAAIDFGELTLRENFDVRRPIQIGRFTIHDDHPLPNGSRATPTNIVAHSSNIGTVQIGLRVGAERQQRFLDNLGLLEASPVEVAGSADPLLPDQWSDLTTATVSFGHGLAVSPIAFASAFSVFANGGDYIPPTILKEQDPLAEPRVPERVMSSPTAQVVVEMLRVAVTEGTGKSADVPGYRVAGKTGTAEKPGPDGYDADRNMTSFSAVFPADDPKYAILIVLDEPTDENGRAVSAAFSAAPAVGRVIERIAPILDVMPYFEDLKPIRTNVRSVSDRRSL